MKTFLMLYGIAGILWTIHAIIMQLRYNPYASKFRHVTTASFNILLWPICLVWAATRTPGQMAKICNGKFLNNPKIYEVQNGLMVAKSQIDHHGAVEFCKQEVYWAYKAMDMEIKKDDEWLKSRQEFDEQDKYRRGFGGE